MPNHWDHAWRIAEILRLLGEGPASLCDLDRVFQPMDWGLEGCDECKVQTWRDDIESRIANLKRFSTFMWFNRPRYKTPAVLWLKFRIRVIDI